MRCISRGSATTFQQRMVTAQLGSVWERKDRRSGNGKMTTAIKGSKVLVTGGAGLVGSHIVDRLINEGPAEILILDNLVRGRRENLASALAHESVTIVEGDIRDPESVKPERRG